MNKLATAGVFATIGLIVLLILVQLGVVVFMVWQMVAALIAAEYLKAAAFGGGLVVLGLLNRNARSN